MQWIDSINQSIQCVDRLLHVFDLRSTCMMYVWLSFWLIEKIDTFCIINDLKMSFKFSETTPKRGQNVMKMRNQSQNECRQKKSNYFDLLLEKNWNQLISQPEWQTCVSFYATTCTGQVYSCGATEMSPQRSQHIVFYLFLIISSETTSQRWDWEASVVKYSIDLNVNALQH